MDAERRLCTLRTGHKRLKTRDKLLLARASLMLAKVIEARGDAARTREAFTRALSLAQACSYTGFVEQAHAYQVRSWLRQGQMEAVTHWQKASPLAHDAPPDYQQEVLALTLVRVLLAQGKQVKPYECWNAGVGMLERKSAPAERLRCWCSRRWPMLS